MTLAEFGAVPGSGSLPRGESEPSGADPRSLDAAAIVVIEEAYAEALDLPRTGSTLAPPAGAPGTERVSAALAVLAAHDTVPLAQAVRAVAGLLALPAARGVSWSRALSGLAVSFPAVLAADGVPHDGTAAWGAGQDEGVARCEDLARLLGAVALARMAARRAGAPFPAAVDRAFAVGVHYLAVRTGLDMSDVPRAACERGATWCEPSFLHALARAWGMLAQGAPDVAEDPRLRWFGVFARQGPSARFPSGAGPTLGFSVPAGPAGSLASGPSPALVAPPRRAGRARAESGPTWDLHAFHAGGCVVAHEHARSGSRGVVACGAPHGIALAWERASGTLLEGRLPGCDDARLVRARVEGRKLCVDGSGPLAGTHRSILRSVRVQPGRWRVIDRLDEVPRPDDAVRFRVAWRFGAGFRMAGGLVRRDGDVPIWEARASCGEEELLVQLPGALDWVVTGGGRALEGAGRLLDGTLLTSSFELRTRGGTS